MKFVLIATSILFFFSDKCLGKEKWGNVRAKAFYSGSIKGGGEREKNMHNSKAEAVQTL